MAEVRVSSNALGITVAALMTNCRTPVPHGAAFLEARVHKRPPATRTDHDSMLSEGGDGVAYTATK